MLRLFACCLLCVFALAGSVVSARADAPERRGYIVVLKAGSSPGEVAAAHGRAYGFEARFLYRHALRGYAATLPPAAAAALSRRPEVLFVSEDGEVSALAQTVPNQIERIDAEASSTASGDGQGSVDVAVAVLDSGIDATHPELNVVGGANCTNDKEDGLIDPGGHGTFVAGLIGARDNGEGVVGVAPGARLWAVRVLKPNGVGSWSMVMCGIDWVTSTRMNADSADDVEVANMSLGGKGSDDGNCGLTKRDAVHLAICNSVAAGVSYVVGAGNSTDDFQRTAPAAYDEVLTATAMADFDGLPGGFAAADPLCSWASDETPAYFSNFSTVAEDQAHTVAAPGVCVLSTSPGNTYRTSSGTSYASPLTAGTVALCIASGACAGLSPAQIISKVVSDAALFNSANPGYGFEGDPLRPIAGRYYGYLIRAGLY